MDHGLPTWPTAHCGTLGKAPSPLWTPFLICKIPGLETFDCQGSFLFLLHRGVHRKVVEGGAGQGGL